MSDESKIVAAGITRKVVVKMEAYRRLSGRDANDMGKHAVAALFEVSGSRDYPPAIPAPCLALGKLIRAAQSAESGDKPAPEQASGGKKKGLTFQPFSKDEVDDALSHVIPGASSWMLELEKKKAEEKAGNDSASPPTP